MSDDVNRVYYNIPQSGRDDYWEKMAAPRFRFKKILELMAMCGGNSAVDLGCGAGQMLQSIHSKFPQWTLCGLDMSERQIQINQIRWPNMDWRCADLTGSRSPFEDRSNTFDVVVALEIIEHVDSPEAFLRNAYDLAKPNGGRLLLSTQSGPVRETERKVGHRRHFSASNMESLLVQTGWRPLRIWNCGFPFHDLSKWAANLSPSVAMDQFSQRPYGIWQKMVCAGLRAAFLLNSRHTGAQLFATAERP